MCARRDPDQVYQAVADLDAELGAQIRNLAYTTVDRRNDGAWVGAHVYYGMLENV